ncbi:hypothetical protein [Nakamurella lactea]|uniref:hypothetical protein n=1 Tax=Nakamurella lactea TaxID=459515 RepID=UPI0004246CEB|nr:hypothetical protein [Nakamurella lactea]
MIRRVSFTQQPGGGVNENEVREILAVLADDIEADEAEIARLRGQLANAGGAGSGPVSIVPDSVNLLSQAQLVADQTIAEAEQYSRDLVETARDQYHEILKRAEQMVAGKPADGGGAPRTAVSADRYPVGSSTSVPQVEYVRTYAKVAEAQLRAVLEALTAEVDKLGRLPELGAGMAGLPAPRGSEFDGPTVLDPAW